jgi:hypothetical protein
MPPDILVHEALAALWGGGQDMDFTLRYEGELPTSSRTNTRATEKHAIRGVFHHQLAELWRLDRRLTGIPLETLPEAFKDERFEYQVQRPIQSAHRFFYKCTQRGIACVPLVIALRFLRCELSVRVNRYEGADFKGRLLGRQGDLDNQVKTLFDALRMPQNEDEVPNGAQHVGPLFCLLEDDALITKLTLEAKRILEPRPGDRSDIWVALDIDVSITPIAPMSGNVEMLFA